jgi:transcriptional regulator with XRE-family HTH domain
MDLKAVFGANLKHYRKLKCLSQEELSEKADISVKHLSAIERGLTFVSADLLQQLATNLTVPVAAFFCAGNEKLVDETTLCKLDRIIEKKLDAAIESIKTEIRSSGIEA